MNFDEMLIRAKSGEEPALTGILELYRPLLMKASIIKKQTCSSGMIFTSIWKGIMIWIR